MYTISEIIELANKTWLLSDWTSVFGTRTLFHNKPNNAGMLPHPSWTSYLPQAAETFSYILIWEATAATATSFHGHCQPIHSVKDSLGEKKPSTPKLITW